MLIAIAISSKPLNSIFIHLSAPEKTALPSGKDDPPLPTISQPHEAGAQYFLLAV
jgi:hypothetical protein